MQALTVKTNENEKILSLDEVFASFSSSKTQWIFDIKAEGIHPEVKNWLERKNIPTNQLMLFGDYEVLNEKVYKESGYRLGYTTIYIKSRNKMLFNPTEMFDRCDKLGSKLMVVPIFFVTTTFIDNASERGIEVWCYDSNDVRDQKYATSCGVKGVIGDYPEKMINAFKDLEKESQPSLR